ncbi:MAG: low molecular weight protein-tyrosine-phosphatase [Fimbriimonadaceae bacterium]|nr:low molecular weight protein-tyrosine-phosphatase [Fimbriimonadaceae bacterium]
MKVLFVCLGNICRSPMAEAILQSKLAARSLADRVLVDSAGTGDWHVGHMPDPRTRQVCAEHGIPCQSRARQLRSADFEEFDLIIGMDDANRRDLLAWAGSDPRRVRLMMEFHPAPSRPDVPDPYYGELSDFRDVYRQLDEAIDGLLTHLSGKL